MNLEKIRENINIDPSKKSKREETINRKIKSLNLLFEDLNVKLDDILSKYNGMYFRNTTILKRDVFQQVMSNSLTESTVNFMIMVEKTVSSHQKDKRDPIDYCSDLIFGWLAEDAIVMNILNNGIPARLNGSDRNREFLKQSELDTAPDIEIGYSGNTRLLEVFSDWTGYWDQHGKADLRDNKYNRLVKDKALLLGTAPLSKTGFLIDVAEQSHGFIYNQVQYGYGNKTGYTSKEIKNYIKPYRVIMKELFNYFKK